MSIEPIFFSCFPSLHPTAKAIDSYIKTKSNATVEDNVPTDVRLDAIVERMFERCEKDGEYKQVRLAFSFSRSPSCSHFEPPI